MVRLRASGYAPLMSRVASLHDAPRESFAGLLDQLTQPAAACNTWADEDADAVRVSISGRGAAALEAERKRAMAPARVAGRRSNRPAAEATEISYERALQLLSRHRSAPLPAQQIADKRPGRPEQQEASTKEKPLSDWQSEGPAAKAGEERKSQRRMPGASANSERAGAVAAASRADSTASQSGSRKKKQKASSHGFAMEASPSTPIANAAQSPSHGQHRHQETSRQDAERRSPGRHSRRSETATIRAETGKEIGLETALKAVSAHRRNHSQNEMPQPMPASAPGTVVQSPRTAKGESQRPSTPSSLEVTRRDCALEQRHAVVSIRVNDMEFDRLRLRAAEAGLSVSAYMRSCVLEAEHLRAQVKQALAEMRSSMHPAQAPPLAAPISILAQDNNVTSGGQWARFLWRSATFFLGPLLAFRHRS
jgi:hypothetical protein